MRRTKKAPSADRVSIRASYKLCTRVQFTRKGESAVTGGEFGVVTELVKWPRDVGKRGCATNKKRGKGLQRSSSRTTLPLGTSGTARLVLSVRVVSRS